MTLDEFVELEKLETIDMIKLDVDGNEVDILKGAANTFKKFKPILLVELSPIHFENDKQPYSFNDQIELLKKLNYNFHDIFNKPVVLNTQKLMETIPRGTLINIIGTPK